MQDTWDIGTNNSTELFGGICCSSYALSSDSAASLLAPLLPVKEFENSNLPRYCCVCDDPATLLLPYPSCYAGWVGGYSRRAPATVEDLRAMGRQIDTGLRSDNGAVRAAGKNLHHHELRL